MGLEQELEEIEIAVEREDGRRLNQMIGEGRRRLQRALKSVRRPMARAAAIDTPLGRLFVADGPRGVVMVHFADSSGTDPVAMLRRHFDLVEDRTGANRIGEEIRRYLDGDRNALTHRADLTLVESDFQRRTFARLCQLPAGSVTTYQALAAMAGAPDAQRAVGNTMASNPVPIYVPCHRVIRSDGSIGNYGGGVERKLKLLRAEGFTFGKDLRVPSDAVLGHQRTRIFCRPECSAARRADRSRMVIFADPQKARRAGLRACKLCRPS